jgi:dihydrofolate synthase/folylpolyglutamate synthase
MSTSAYQQALDYIYSFVDYSVERSYRYSAEVFELARVRDLLDRLGAPDSHYPSIHIAGTKGKGSVAAFISSCLQTAGYKTGLYTSPHLQRFTERIQVDNQEIDEQSVSELVELLKEQVPHVAGLTTYELITALGFLHFQKCAIDIAVVEVGLGGRLDATNVITPLVSVITPISYDHMHLLGDSLSDIAGEKAGIIKPGVPVVSAPQQYEVEGVLRDFAESNGSEMILVGKDWLFSPGRHSTEGQSLYIWSQDEQSMMDLYIESAGKEEWIPPRFEIQLLGYHQVINATTAYAALSVVKKAGIFLSNEKIAEGFIGTKWPGRFQVLSTKPIVLIDSAHNRDSALKLRLALDDYFPGQRVTLIFGASEDKDIAGMLVELMPRISNVIVTRANHPRAAEVIDLAKQARTYGISVEEFGTVSSAMEYAIRNSDDEDVILATGSLFVAGEALTAWENISDSLQSVMQVDTI